MILPFGFRWFSFVEVVLATIRQSANNCKQYKMRAPG